MSASKTFFLAPANRGAGLTSMALGLVRALQREGLDVGFVKPISQPEASSQQLDPSTHFARALCGIESPAALTFRRAEQCLREGQMDALMEEVVAQVEEVRARHCIVVVEGLVPCDEAPNALTLNAAMRRSLAAALIPVLGADCLTAEGLAEVVNGFGRHFADPGLLPAGILINKVSPPLSADRLRRQFAVPLLAAVPYEARLRAPRLGEVVDALSLRVIHEGATQRARVHQVVVGAQTVDRLVARLAAGTLVVAPADRSDVALATGLAYLSGVPLAGLVLTCGGQLPEAVLALLEQARGAGMPIFGTDYDSYTTCSHLAALNCRVGSDDAPQMEQVIDFIAAEIDCAPLRDAGPDDDRMPPPAFRHRLIQAARQADKRIVLPEGDEPRTIQAAVLCHHKRIARCVLLGNPAAVHESARGLGLSLPEGLEIVDPALVRARYVAPMVEMRRGKGLTAAQAWEQLEDSVVLGTMMLALGEVDGLVSGAVHTTANTIRPALQLIKTRPGVSTVSSVFFMLMPDQVFVYGDCAVNPNPTAEQLAEIAIQSAESAKAFGIDPRVAMISYSTGSSGSGEDVETVRSATRLARARRPDLLIDGPMQYDAATVESVGRQKAPDSPVAGRANVFVFPDLNTGNTTYKAVQRSANVVSVGPMLQGLRKPVNDLSRGALVDDIVYTIALTAIQAQQPELVAPQYKEAV